jgi:hypothetical protein
MKRKGLVLFLGAEAVFCIVLFLAQASLPWIFSSMIAFPFEQIGAGYEVHEIKKRCYRQPPPVWVIITEVLSGSYFPDCSASIICPVTIMEG